MQVDKSALCGRRDYTFETESLYRVDLFFPKLPNSLPSCPQAMKPRHLPASVDTFIRKGRHHPASLRCRAGSTTPLLPR